MTNYSQLNDDNEQVLSFLAHILKLQIDSYIEDISKCLHDFDVTIGQIESLADVTDKNKLTKMINEADSCLREADGNIKSLKLDLNSPDMEKYDRSILIQYYEKYDKFQESYKNKSKKLADVK